MKIINSQSRFATGPVILPAALVPTTRVLRSSLPNVATAITLVNNTAYFVYVGQTMEDIIVKFVEFYVNTLGSGTQNAEVGLFQTASPPNKSNQGTNGITKIKATGSLDSLTVGLGLKRNQTALDQLVPAGTQLWAGIRTAMTSNQPAIGGVCMDYGEGMILTKASAGALTDAGPWTGSLITPAGYLNTALAPDLRVTLD